jgi:hypothetical protein
MLASVLAMLESGQVKNLAGGVDNSYVSRMKKRTTLTSDIVAAILEDALPDRTDAF